MHSFTFSPVSPGIWLATRAFVSFHVAYLPAPGKSVSYFCPNSTGSWKTHLYTFPTSLMKITGLKGQGDTDIAVLAAKASSVSAIMGRHRRIHTEIHSQKKKSYKTRLH